MSEEEKEQILKVLSGAIRRETGAFNFYSGKSEDQAMPRSVRGLLSRLAEKEMCSPSCCVVPAGRRR